VQMRGGTQHSYAPCANEVELVQKKGEHSTIFICYVACVDDIELVKMRGGTVQLCNLYK